MRVFGCACFPFLRPFNQHKLDFRSRQCVFLGPSTSHHGYKCLDDNGRVFVSRHVRFDEQVFPFDKNQFVCRCHRQEIVTTGQLPILYNKCGATLLGNHHNAHRVGAISSSAYSDNLGTTPLGAIQDNAHETTPLGAMRGVVHEHGATPLELITVHHDAHDGAQSPSNNALGVVPTRVETSRNACVEELNSYAHGAPNSNVHGLQGSARGVQGNSRVAIVYKRRSNAPNIVNGGCVGNAHGVQENYEATLNNDNAPITNNGVYVVQGDSRGAHVVQGDRSAANINNGNNSGSYNGGNPTFRDNGAQISSYGTASHDNDDSASNGTMPNVERSASKVQLNINAHDGGSFVELANSRGAHNSSPFELENAHGDGAMPNIECGGGSHGNQGTANINNESIFNGCSHGIQESLDNGNSGSSCRAHGIHEENHDDSNYRCSSREVQEENGTTEPCIEVQQNVESGVPQTISNVHPMMTRSKHGIWKPKVYNVAGSDREPSNITEALMSPHWKEAAQAEYDALVRNGTWTLVPLPRDRKAVNCKWIFRVKRNADGSISRYKARLVAKGFLQKPGIDFDEVFSPVVKPATIRVIISLALSRGWKLRQVDVNNAFLNGLLTEEVYMSQPPGYEQGSGELVCKLHKAIYGLKQAPRAWFERLKAYLQSEGFCLAKSDASLYVRKTSDSLVYLLVYVDDIILTGDKEVVVQSVIDRLNAQFSLKDLGPLHFFLGVEVSYEGGDVVLSQQKYIQDLLQKHGFGEVKSLPTPMVSNIKLSAKEGTPLEDAAQYRSIVGALQYIVITRPDVVFAVNRVCQFMQAPLDVHFLAVKRILRYLQGTIDFGLRFTPSSRMALTAAEMVWLQSLLGELHVVSHGNATLRCDNTSAVAVCVNPVLHSKFKHVELDLFFVREMVAMRQLQVHEVPAVEQVVDVLTKPLSAPWFLKHRQRLLVVQLKSRSD
ncbi:hypothetical protein F3Y22_tig00000340pilonHSYRG00251 [Hibiscus syriacus]|uniref:Uncharacterized protein n=1 Tax=Hibiscus syriacus TaxID=106335 RepID=A0A6A3D5Y8_HIBSY|nr:hypothetical protein F3Y22_tig00000340pilonHSYRG00251 [Hibiscus syriacus]